MAKEFLLIIKFITIENSWNWNNNNKSAHFWYNKALSKKLSQNLTLLAFIATYNKSDFVIDIEDLDKFSNM